MRARRTVAAFALMATAAFLLSGTAGADTRPGTVQDATPAVAGVADPLPVTGAEESLGEPFSGAVLSPEAAQGHDAEGRPQVYWVTNGNADIPAMFQVTDIRSGEVVFAQRVPAGDSSWASTFSDADGTVYFGMTAGQMYSWTPGDAQITDLGTPLAGEGVWHLDAAPDGTIYGGTYPGGRFFSFDPNSGVVIDHGQAVPGETYLRQFEVDEEYVWVGTQPRARLARFDRSDGTFEQIPLPAEYEGEKVVQDMTLAGGRLFLRVYPVNDLLVLDPTTGQVVDIVRDISERAISGLDPTGRFVFFRRLPDGIVKYDVTSGEITPLGWAPDAIQGNWAFVDLDDPDFPGLTLSMTNYYGRGYLFNLETSASRFYDAGLEGSATRIHTIGQGPDSNIYVSGYLQPPGMAQFDPDSGQTTLLPGAGQIEGMGALGSNMLLGRYPKGGLLVFDTSQPWDAFNFETLTPSDSTNPGPGVVIGEEQDRPHSIVTFGDRAAVSSVPMSGRLGGAVSIWDPATGEVDVHRDVVEDQSVVSLLEHEGTLIGGTAIMGGFGIEPVADSAVLFAFEPETGVTEVIGAPLAGASAVNALTRGPDGQVWGLADGTLFTYDPDNRRITRAEQLFPQVHLATYGVAQRGLEFREGYLYAVSSGSLWRVDPTNWAVSLLASDKVRHLAQDDDGNLYYGRAAELYRWNFALDSGQPEPGEDSTGESSEDDSDEATEDDDDSQMEETPQGGVDTGDGGTSGIENAGLIGAGSLALLGGATLLARRRFATDN